MTDKHNKKLLYFLLLIIGFTLVIFGFVLNPSFVSKHLSPDGVLKKVTIIEIYITESLAITLGFVIFLYSLLKITKSIHVKKIDEKIQSILIRRLSKKAFFIWAILFMIAIVSGLRFLRISDRWQSAQGWEYFWIAESIAGGHGFSIASCHRWMFVDFRSSYSCDEYSPTALEEPVYPILMALSFKAFGKYGKFAILVFQLITLFFISVVMYFLGRKVFNWQTGILAAFIVAIWPIAHYLATRNLGPTVFGGFIISISAFLILWSLEKVSIRRGIALGLMLGFNCLTLASTLFFIPISVILLLLSARPLMPVVWKTAFSILLTACIVVSPWTVRNLLVFGQFVPVRTGFGLATHQGNPIMAATFSAGSHACSDTLGPLWKAQNVKEAIILPRNDKEKRFAIYKRSFDCIEQGAPEGYERFNEAERDKIYLMKTLEFIFSEPRTFAILTYYKFLLFFRGWSRLQAVVSLLAFVVAIIAWRNQGSRILILLVFVYTFSYSLGVSWFYRYRYPIEPILILLASYIPIFAISKFIIFVRKLP
ncbi:MAG: ArnT family glycosyltransferase [Candidatus Hodarchaeota archaeon]